MNIELFYRCWRLAVFAALAVNGLGGAVQAETSCPPAISQALAKLQLTPAELTVNVDPTMRDAFRLKLADRWLASPLEFPVGAQGIIKDLAVATNLAAVIRTAAERVEWPTVAASGDDLVSAGSLSDPAAIALNSLPDLLAARGLPARQAEWKRAGHEIRRASASLAPSLAQALALGAVSMAAAQRRLDAAFPFDGSKDRRESLMRRARDLAIMTRGRENEKRLDEDWFTDARQVRVEAMIQAAVILATGVERMKAELLVYRQESMTNEALAAAKVEAVDASAAPVRRALVDVNTPAGRFVVGGVGDDTYTATDIALLIEPGGNDRYLAPVGVGLNGVAIAVDVAGDDGYQTDAASAFGCGCLGVGILVDMEGRDRYVAADLALGAGVFGVGILEDLNGDDTYSAHVFAEGSAFFGVGVLLDRRGNDMYAGGLMAQGVGQTRGFGLLMDRQGEDTYVLGGVERGWAASAGNAMAAGQGFGCGLRGYASGGIGALIDLAGNDRYLAGAAAQGAGYWYGLGLLADGAGDDVYQCPHYGQATAFHDALGFLWDLSGNDYYKGGVATQAGSWDRGVSVFIDQAGDDVYEAADLALGGAAVNGVALFLDLAGNDVYRCSSNTVMGYGRFDERRGTASFGWFWDGQGWDAYAGGTYSNNLEWIQGERGLGWDVETHVFPWAAVLPIPFDSVTLPLGPLLAFQPFPAAVPDSGQAGSATQALAELTITYPQATQAVPKTYAFPATPAGARQLIDWASNWAGPDNDEQRKPLWLLFQSYPGLFAPALADTLRSPSFHMSWQVAGPALISLGSAAVPALNPLVESPNAETRVKAIYCLGQIRDKRTWPVMIQAMNDPSWKVRATAIIAMRQWRPDGEGEAEDEDDLLRDTMLDPHPAVRMNAVRAMADSRDPKSIDTLAAVLSDRDGGIRDTAARSLAQRGDEGVAVLVGVSSPIPANTLAAILLGLNEYVRRLDAERQIPDAVANRIVALVKQGLADESLLIRQRAERLASMIRDGRNERLRGALDASP